MRYLGLLLIWCLLAASQAAALDFCADFLYWKATENVDWVLNTNRDPANQFVAYETIEYDFEPGFRVGVAHEGSCDTKFSYTRYFTSTEDSASGNLTGAFLGAKESQPPAPKLYYDTGQVAAEIDYNMFDLDFGKRFYVSPSAIMRPTIGIKGGWINQSFDTAFQAQYAGTGGTVDQSVVENMTNNFWGIGPKVGIENVLNLARGQEFEINGSINFYTAYLIGDWNINDVTRSTTIENGVTDESTHVVGVESRDFGAVTFQAIVGLQVNYRRWNGSIGYEINDWLNQCQIFDDATGPHNNDLILQGLNATVGFSY